MSAPDPLVGQSLGHYRILEKIGQGGMGVVYRALDTRLDRQVAVKLVHPDLLADPDTRRRFLSEARAASAISHPNICAIYAIEEAAGQLFLALEFLEGATLSERAADLRGNVKALLDCVIQGAEGLAEAHRRGVVHRDIKCANLWVMPRGQVKIMDFGLAKSMRDRPTATEDTPTQEITLTGMTVGTIHYMSPEQALGRAVDPRSDIFSFGVVLYEVATGRQPFSGANSVETFDQILHLEPPPPSSLDPRLPSEFDRIVMKALQKDPEERYQTAADLAVDLRAVRRGLESGQHPISRTMPAATSSGSFPVAGEAVAASALAPGSSGAVPAGVRHSPMQSALLAGGAVLLVVAVTLGGVAFMGRKQTVEVASASAGRPTVAVMVFENRTGEPRNNWYGTNTTELLGVVLAKLPNLDVISKQRIYDVLGDLKGSQGGATALDPRSATEAAKKSGARYMIRGDVLSLSGSVILTAEVLEVETGKVIGAERVTSVNEQNMLDKVDELGRLLSERLKELK